MEPEIGMRDLYVIDQSWTIDKIDMNGRYSFAEFNLVMSYGRDFRRFILPEKADLFLRYRVLGNAVATTYILPLSIRKWNGWRRTTKAINGNPWT